MENKNMTALVSCFSRAYHNKNYAFKIYNDSLAEKILSKKEYDDISENMIKGIHYFNSSFMGTNEEALRHIVDNQLSPSVLGRSIFTEKSLQNSKRLGVKQYLIFASGYDTSGYKEKNLKIFEIDKEEMIKDKIKRLDDIKLDYSNTKLIGADLNEKYWIDLLFQNGYKKEEKSFCSLLGISYYLEKKNFESLISEIANILSSGSEIVFDYPLILGGKIDKINEKLANASNEKMKAKYSLFELELILEKYDILIYENLNNKDMDSKYFYNYNTINPNHHINSPIGVGYCLAIKK